MSHQLSAKAKLWNKETTLSAGLSVAGGLLVGVLSPWVITQFLNGLTATNRSSLWPLFVNLTAVAALAALAQFLQWRVESVAVIILRLRVTLQLAQKLVGFTGASLQGVEFEKAIQAHTLKAQMFWGEIPAFSVGVGGFLFLLIQQKLPWWVYVTFVVLVAASVTVYGPLKESRWGDAGKAENDSNACLSLLAQESGLQVRPALLRAVYRAAEEAKSKRHYAYMHTTQACVGVRLLVGLLVLALAALSAVLNRTELDALFMVFVLAFNGHLSRMHYILQSLRDISADGGRVAELLDTPALPVLQPQPGRACIQTRRLHVVYPGQNGQTKLVEIPDTTVLRGQNKILNSPNGSGKTTFFMAISGGLPQGYSGSLQLFGVEAGGLDASRLLVSLRQHQLKLSITVEDLFVDEEGEVCVELRDQALAWANVGFELSELHSELSGGQRQGANLALCFYEALHRPGVELVLLDEPTNHLDNPSKEVVTKSLVTFVQQVNVRDISVLIATHKLDVKKALIHVL